MGTARAIAQGPRTAPRSAATRPCRISASQKLDRREQTLPCRAQTSPHSNGVAVHQPHRYSAQHRSGARRLSAVSRHSAPISPYVVCCLHLTKRYGRKPGSFLFMPCKLVGSQSWGMGVSARTSQNSSRGRHTQAQTHKHGYIDTYIPISLQTMEVRSANVSGGLVFETTRLSTTPVKAVAGYVARVSLNPTCESRPQS